MTDSLIQDIQSYLAGDWDTYEIEVIGLLERCLNALAQREEDSVPATPTPGVNLLYVGAAVRVQSPLAGSYGKTGRIEACNPDEVHPWEVDFGDYSAPFSSWELELI